MLRDSGKVKLVKLQNLNSPNFYTQPFRLISYSNASRNCTAGIQGLTIDVSVWREPHRTGSEKTECLRETQFVDPETKIILKGQSRRPGHICLCDKSKDRKEWEIVKVVW